MQKLHRPYKNHFQSLEEDQRNCRPKCVRLQRTWVWMSGHTSCIRRFSLVQPCTWCAVVLIYQNFGFTLHVTVWQTPALPSRGVGNILTFILIFLGQVKLSGERGQLLASESPVMKCNRQDSQGTGVGTKVTCREHKFTVISCFPCSYLARFSLV